MPRSVLLVPVVLCLVVAIVVGRFHLRHNGKLEHPILLGYCVEFWLSATSFVPMLLTIFFFSKLQHGMRLLSSCCSSKPGGAEEAIISRFFSPVEVVHWVLVATYWFGLSLAQTALFWRFNTSSNLRHTTNMIFFIIAHYLFTLMRDLLVRELKCCGARQAEKIWKHITRNLTIVLAVQFTCAIYTLTLASGGFPITSNITHARLPGESIADSNSSWYWPDVCEALSPSYFNQYCSRSGTASAREDLPDFVCHDGGYKGFRSRADACTIAGTVHDIYVRSYSAWGISINVLLTFVFTTVTTLRVRLDDDNDKVCGVVPLEWLVQLSHVVAISCVPVFLSCLLLPNLTGVVADQIYFTHMEFFNTSAWLVAFIFLNSKVLLRETVLSKLVGFSADASYDCFLSHAWGADERGRNNHERVHMVNAALRTHGISTWFDNDNMAGNINAAMSRGIENSNVILVFVTQSYVDKVNSESEDNNVKFEFEHAQQQRGSAAMIPIVMEPQVAGSHWKSLKGRFSMILGRHLFHDLTADFPESLRDLAFDEAHSPIPKLVKEIQSQLLQRRASSGKPGGFRRGSGDRRGSGGSNRRGSGDRNRNTSVQLLSRGGHAIVRPEAPPESAGGGCAKSLESDGGHTQEREARRDTGERSSEDDVEKERVRI